MDSGLAASRQSGMTALMSRKVLSCAPRLRPHQPVKHFDKTVDVGLVVVDVRTDPQPAKPRREVDILGGEPPDQSIPHAAPKAETQNVRRPHPRVGDLQTTAAAKSAAAKSVAAKSAAAKSAAAKPV